MYLRGHIFSSCGSASNSSKRQCLGQSGTNVCGGRTNRRSVETGDPTNLGLSEIDLYDMSPKVPVNPCTDPKAIVGYWSRCLLESMLRDPIVG